MAERERPPSEVRRKLLQASAAAAGSVALGSLPWSRPEIKSFFGVRSAYAVPTFALQQTVDGQLGSSPGTTQSTGQDRWQFPVYRPDTTVTITVESLDGNSDLELFLYLCDDVPASCADDAVNQTNLLTGNALGLDVNGPGGTETAVVVLASRPPFFQFPVCYVLAIEDQRGPGSEVSGTYRITLQGDQEIGCPELICNESPESDQPEIK